MPTDYNTKPGDTELLFSFVISHLDITTSFCVNVAASSAGVLCDRCFASRVGAKDCGEY